MTWQCTPGSCLIIPSGSIGSHLFVVALGPARFEGHAREDHVIMVSFSSIKPDLYHDNTCEVEPGEHSFINRKSYVYYREPRIYRVSEVQQRVRQGCGRYTSSYVVNRSWIELRQAFGSLRCSLVPTMNILIN